MRHITTSLLTIAVLTGTTAHSATPNMKEGLWEITTKMEVPGMPAGMPPQVMQKCFTQEDFKDPRQAVPGKDARDARCKMTDHKVQGNSATWNMACEDGTKGVGTATYSGTTYTSTNTITSSRGGKAQTMTMHYSGRHLGACKK